MRNVRPIEMMYTGSSRSSSARICTGEVWVRSTCRDPSGRDVEGVLLAARGVIGREVQRVEVELLGLDLGPFGQFPAHRDEGVGDVLGQDRDRVPGADRLAGRGQRHVDALGDQHRGVAFGAQRGEALVVGPLGLGAGDVDPLACVGAVGLGQRSQRLTGQRDGRRGRRGARSWRAPARPGRLPGRRRDGPR